MHRILIQRAIKDLIEGICTWRIWLTLGYQDIRLRYLRSIIGPFWITLSMGAMIYTMGFLYAKLFKVDLHVYYPYIAAGMITWNFIAISISESADIFFQSANFIKQIKVPYTVYLLRLITRNTLIYFHNLLVVIPIIIIFDVPVSLLSILTLIINIFIINLCAFCVLYIISIIGTRFQDVRPIINTFVQILFLLTPVIWMPAMIPDRFNFMAEYNPLYQIITLVREPMLGKIPSLFTYGYIFTFLTATFLVMIVLLCRCRHRIAFWV